MNLHDEIQRLAYALYEGSGCIPGRCVDNWLEAERIVLTQIIVVDETPSAGVQETAVKPAKPKKATAPKAKKAEKKATVTTKKGATSVAKGKTTKKK